MSSALESAIEMLAHRLGAASIVVWREAGQNSDVIAAYPVDMIAHGAPWPCVGVDRGRSVVADDQSEIASAVSAQLRIRLVAPVRSAVVVATRSSNLAFTVVWTEERPTDADILVRAAVDDGLDLMAVDLDRRIRLAIEHGRLSSLMDSLDQPVVIFARDEAVGVVNWPAAELLGLNSADSHPAQTVRDAFRRLRDRSTQPRQFDSLLARVIENPSVSIRHELLHLLDPTQYFRVSTTPYSVDGRSGRVWTFDEVTAEMLALAKLETSAADLAESRQRYESLAEHAADIVFRSGVDGRLEWISQTLVDVLGFDVEALLGTNFADLLHPEDFQAMSDAAGRLGAGDRVEYRARFRSIDGSYRWLDITARLVGDAYDGSLRRIGSARDVTSQVEAERALERSETMLRTVIDGMLEPQVLLRPVRDARGEFVDFEYVTVNRATEAALGTTRSEIEGRTLRDFQPGRDDAGLVALYAEKFMAAEPIVIDGFRYDHPSLSQSRYFDIRGTRIDDLMSLTWRDVTEQMRATRELEHAASTDPLTGVLNRAAGVTLATAKLQARRTPGDGVALLFCDIDHFKELNDAFGHRAGDEVLQTLAARLREVVRSADVVARLGGDEFLVVLDGVHGTEEAAALAEKVRGVGSAPIVSDRGVIRPSMSIGVVLGSHGEDFDALLARADAALYVAKGAGRNRVVVADVLPLQRTDRRE